MAFAGNPCQKEHEQSMACLDQNNYDKEKCQMHFDNYKICKRFWGDLTAYRRRNGISPNLPDEAEREKIKADHIAAVAAAVEAHHKKYAKKTNPKTDP